MTFHCCEHQSLWLLNRLRGACSLSVITFGLLWGQIASGQVVITGQESLSGVVVSTGDSRISIRDSSGTLHDLKIQSPDERAVALSGGVALRFSADVEVTGRYPIDSVERGQAIRFHARMNRRGDIDGKVDVVWQLSAGDQGPGVYAKSNPAHAQQFVECEVIGAFQRTSNGRLLVQVPRNDFTRKKTLSASLGDNVEVRLASSDHRTAAPGARVVEAVVATFNTGDRAVRRLRISTGSDSTAERKFDDELALKYRHLSDEPVAPRLVRSRHFMLQTDISERQAGILVEKLERMITLLSNYFGARPKGLVQAYVVHDLSQWPEGMLAEPAGIAKIREGAGICFSRRRGSQAEAIVYSCDQHGVVQHESTHAYCTLAFGSTGPTWLAEGVAEMGQYWKADEVAVVVDPMVLQYLQSTRPKRTLGEIAVPGRTAAGGWQDYAWRWALCHLLANNPNYSERFKPLAIALMSEQEGASFAAAYGDVKDQISFEYDQFLQTLDNGYDARLCAWQWGRRFAPLRGARSAKTTVLAQRGWQPTGVRVDHNQRYNVSAKGNWQLSSKGEPLSPDGETGGRGQLVGAVFTDYSLSEPLPLGVDATFTAPQAGDFYVRCQDAWHSLSDNSGTIELQIRLAGEQAR